MDNKERLNKLFYTLALIGFALWFGGIVARNAIAYDLLEITEQLNIKTRIDQNEYWFGIYHFTNLGAYTSTGFLLLFLSAVVLLIVNRKNLRFKGWLFMAISCFILSLPINILLLYHDIMLGLMIYYQNIKDITNIGFEKYFLSRFTDITMNALSTLSYLLCLSSAIIIIWKPLNLEQKANEKNET